MAEKVSPTKLADLAIMRAMGMSHEKIAEALDISVRTVERHVAGLRKRAEEVGVHQAFLEVLMQAGPFYLLRVTPLRMTPEEIAKELEVERK